MGSLSTESDCSETSSQLICEGKVLALPNKHEMGMCGALVSNLEAGSRVCTLSRLRFAVFWALASTRRVRGSMVRANWLSDNSAFTSDSRS